MIMIKAVMQTLGFALIGCLSNDAGDGYRNAASNFIALNPSRLIRQMLATFLELYSKGLHQSSGKEKESR